jgi:hypothetical protein
VTLRWAQAFPYHDTFGSIVVRYDDVLREGTAVFKATVTVGNGCVAAGEHVMVKFVQGSYGIMAHRYMAEHDLAPTVHVHKRLGRRWHVVVMAYVDSTAIATGELGEQRKQQLRQLMETLHGGGFVFGDFRLRNVLCRRADGQLLLCDFDWAGKEGRAKYPQQLNPDIRWRVGVCDGGPITKAHDLVWLERHLKGEAETVPIGLSQLVFGSDDSDS